MLDTALDAQLLLWLSPWEQNAYKTSYLIALFVFALCKSSLNGDDPVGGFKLYAIAILCDGKMPTVTSLITVINLARSGLA